MPEILKANTPTGKFLKDDGTWDVAGGGASAFTDLTDVPAAYTGDALKVVRVNAGETALEFVTLAGGGDMLGSNNLSDVASAATSRTNLGIDTTANQTDSADKRFMSDAQEAIVDGVTAALAGKAPSLGADDNYVTDAEKVVIGNTSGTNSGDNAVNTLYSGLVTNATHTGDATGATALTVVKIQGKDFPTLTGADDQKYPKYVSASNAFVMTTVSAGPGGGVSLGLVNATHLGFNMI